MGPWTRLQCLFKVVRNESYHSARGWLHLQCLTRTIYKVLKLQSFAPSLVSYSGPLYSFFVEKMVVLLQIISAINAGEY